MVQARGLLCRLHLRSRWFGHILAEPYLPRPPWCAGSNPPCAQSHHQFPARADSAAAGPSVFSLRLMPVGYLASEPTTPAPRSPWRAGLKPECSEGHQQFEHRWTSTARSQCSEHRCTSTTRSECSEHRWNFNRGLSELSEHR